jgi:hypothetical protein
MAASRKFTGEKLSNSFLARIKEYYPNDAPLKSGKDSVIFKDITKTPTKQNTIERFVLQYKMTEEQPTQQEIECYENKLEEIRVQDEMQRLHGEQLNIEFRKELRALLEKYNASIDFSCSDCSDTHGIYDAKMVACFTLSDRMLAFDLSNSWSVDKHEF